MKIFDRLKAFIENNEREFDRLMEMVASDDDVVSLPTLHAFHGAWSIHLKRSA